MIKLILIFCVLVKRSFQTVCEIVSRSLSARNMEIQHQIRRNVQEINDYIKDLDSWSNDIDLKDRQLAGKLGTTKKDSGAPSVRKRATVTAAATGEKVIAPSDFTSTLDQPPSDDDVQVM